MRERAVRMVSEAVEGSETECAARRRIAELLGVGSTETRVGRHEDVDAGALPGVTTEERAEIKRLKRGRML